MLLQIITLLLPHRLNTIQDHIIIMFLVIRNFGAVVALTKKRIYGVREYAQHVDIMNLKTIKDLAKPVIQLCLIVKLVIIQLPVCIVSQGIIKMVMADVLNVPLQFLIVDIVI